MARPASEDADLVLSGTALLANTHAVQRAQNLPLSDAPKGQGAPGRLDIEIQAGTGMTYTHTKTIFERNKLLPDKLSNALT